MIKRGASPSAEVWDDVAPHVPCQVDGCGRHHHRISPWSWWWCSGQSQTQAQHSTSSNTMRKSIDDGCCGAELSVCVCFVFGKGWWWSHAARWDMSAINRVGRVDSLQIAHRLNDRKTIYLSKVWTSVESCMSKRRVKVDLKTPGIKRSNRDLGLVDLQPNHQLLQCSSFTSLVEPII